VKLYNYLCEEKKMYLLAKQILRSGTSIGANVAEALAAQTDHFDSIYRDNLELLKILSSIAITTRQKDEAQSIKNGKQTKP